MLQSMLLLLALTADCTASAKAFTGAQHDAPFFVFDGGSRGEGLGEFDHPGGIASVGGGLLAIADTRNKRVKIVTFEGFFQDFWDGVGQPVGIAADGRSVWVVDSANDRVRRLTLTSDDVFALTGAVEAEIGGFDSPAGAAVDSKGRLYVADSGNHRVRVFTRHGRSVRQWTRELREPFGIAIDAKDHIYVTDVALHRVSKFDASGKLLARWGTRGANAGQFVEPRGIAVDRDGNVYVADSGNDRVQKFTPDGTFLGSIGCTGSGEGEFRAPWAVAIDEERHLYVVDSGNHRIQKLGHQ